MIDKFFEWNSLQLLFEYSPNLRLFGNKEGLKAQEKRNYMETNEG
jgi:hypothetical protein